MSPASWSARYVSAIDVTLTSDVIAPFVWLTVVGVKGHFSDNGFLMTQPRLTVTFLALEKVTTSEVKVTVTSLLDHWPTTD